MESKKGKTILIVVAIVVVLAFVGVSAFRYFTVVAPNQGANQEEVAEQPQDGEQQDSTGENQTSDTNETTTSDETSSKQEQNVVSYEGEAARLFSILDNFNWINTDNEYLDFNSDGTVGKGTQRSNFNSSDFMIRSVEGSIDDPAGCEAVVSSGEKYGILRFIQNTPDTAAYFTDAPESDYRIESSLFGDASYYKVMTDGVVVDGYEFGAPDEVLAHQSEIDAKISELVANELPAVSKVTWNKTATLEYTEAGQSILLMYTCNNPNSTVVTVTYSPDTGDIQLFAGNDENSFTEAQISTDVGSDSSDVTSGQASPEELALAAEREAAQDSNEGGNQ